MFKIIVLAALCAVSLNPDSLDTTLDSAAARTDRKLHVQEYKAALDSVLRRAHREFVIEHREEIIHLMHEQDFAEIRRMLKKARMKAVSARSRAYADSVSRIYP